MNPRDPTPSTDEEVDPSPSDEVLAGTWSRLLLVSTPFVLLLVLFLLDRWVRG
ncbi:hypothetical protein BH23GEM11_BH23GEM11_17140 [soil metagenome]